MKKYIYLYIYTSKSYYLVQKLNQKYIYLICHFSYFIYKNEIFDINGIKLKLERERKREQIRI